MSRTFSDSQLSQSIQSIQSTQPIQSIQLIQINIGRQISATIGNIIVEEEKDDIPEELSLQREGGSCLTVTLMRRIHDMTDKTVIASLIASFCKEQSS